MTMLLPVALSILTAVSAPARSAAPGPPFAAAKQVQVSPVEASGTPAAATGAVGDVQVEPAPDEQGAPVGPEAGGGGGETMVFGGGEGGAEEGGGTTMSFAEQGPATPTVRPVQTPPPAAQSLSVPTALEVRVTARRVVADEIRLVPIEIRAPENVRTLRGTATLGEVRETDRAEPGRFESYLALPALRGPAIILALYEGDGCAGYVRIAVWKSANLDVSTEPGAQVRVEIADQTYGPVRAQGRTATVPVEIPPGAETARVVARDEAGNETSRTIDLPRQRFPLALIVPPAAQVLADDGPVLPVLVAATNKWGGVPATWSLDTETGALGDPAEITGGLRVYPWRPSRALGDKAFVVRQDDGETRLVVTMIAGPPTGIEIQAEPDILPANGLSTSTIYAGVSDGLGHYVDAGPIDVRIAGGTTVQTPAQTGAVVLATVAADRMVHGGDPPAAIVVSAHGGGYDGVVAIRQFDPESRGLRLTPAATRLTADGESRTDLRVELLDGLGEPLPIDGRADLAALGGTVPPSVDFVQGVGTFALQAGTAAGISTVRATVGDAVAHATVSLDPGPPDHLRVEVVPDPAGAGGTWTVRVRLEDRFGNGISADHLPDLGATTDRGTLGAFVPVEVHEVEDVGWMAAPLTLPPDERRSADVAVQAGSWSGEARTPSASTASLYVAAMGGYLHNLGDAGFFPARLGVGWIDAFGLRGLLFGVELGYLGLRLDVGSSPSDSEQVTGDALTACAVIGYRWAANSWFALLAELALGADVAWFGVSGSGATPALGSGATAAFNVGVRLGAGFIVGPGMIVLDVSYDDARYHDLVRGNVGGLGGLLGYRLEI